MWAANSPIGDSTKLLKFNHFAVNWTPPYMFLAIFQLGTSPVGGVPPVRRCVIIQVSPVYTFCQLTHTDGHTQGVPRLHLSISNLNMCYIFICSPQLYMHCNGISTHFSTEIMYAMMRQIIRMSARYTCSLDMQTFWSGDEACLFSLGSRTKNNEISASTKQIAPSFLKWH